MRKLKSYQTTQPSKAISTESRQETAAMAFEDIPHATDYQMTKAEFQDFTAGFYQRARCSMGLREEDYNP